MDSISKLFMLMLICSTVFHIRSSLLDGVCTTLVTLCFESFRGIDPCFLGRSSLNSYHLHCYCDSRILNYSDSAM